MMARIAPLAICRPKLAETLLTLDSASKAWSQALVSLVCSAWETSVRIRNSRYCRPPSCAGP